MRFSISLFLILILVSNLNGQGIEGSWIMSYVKSKQPVFTMMEKDGELVVEESANSDSTIVYNSGLMHMTVLNPDSAISYSWEGQELWQIEITPDEIQFIGPKDTLYGNFRSSEMLVLKSTLDDTPNEYFFERLQFKKNKELLVLTNTSWSVKGKDNFLNGQKISFSSNHELISTRQNFSKAGEYSLYPLGAHYAIEFTINTPTTYSGIIYITELKKSSFSGIFYQQEQGGLIPKRKTVSFQKIN